MKYRIVAMLTATVLCLGLIFAGGLTADAYTDVSDPAQAEAVTVLQGLGIVDGYSDGGYHPDDTLTRAQFCKLIITAMGMADKATASGYRTLFNDLSTGHWAVGYVNLAYDQGLISGYGNGAFGPEDPVNLAQAVTMALKALGYTTADIGPFWPEDYLSKAAKLGLTDDLSAESGASLTRGEAAVLLYAMLSTENTNGKIFGLTLGASEVSSALLMDNQAEGTDGRAGMVQVYANGTVSYYEQAHALPDGLVGQRGTLLFNLSGKVIGLLPDELTQAAVSVAQVTARGITSADGKTYSISGTLPVVLKGEKTTYEKAWYSMASLGSVTLYYNASGSVDLIWAGTANAGERAYVLTVSTGQETILRSIFSISGTVNLRKNGEEAAYSDLAPYDVVTYDAASRTLLASDRRVTGCYENASPSTQAPTSVTLLGAEFDVLDCALDSLEKFDVGDRMTLLLTSEGSVAAAYDTGSVTAPNIGIYDGTTVTLPNGIQLSGTISGGSGFVGAAVKVSSSAIGKLSISAASGSGVSGALKVAEGTLGKYSLAPGAVMYDQVGGASAVQLNLSDLKMNTISNGKITSAIVDGSGQISYLFLNDATGDCYTYGKLSTKMVSGGNTEDGIDYSYQTVAVTNGDGEGKYYANASAIKAVGGLALTGTGSGVKVVDLTKLKVTRGEVTLGADGENYVVAGEAVWPISANVQVYNTLTKQWTGLEAAMAFTDNFSMYYDRPADQGGQIRVIYAE